MEKNEKNINSEKLNSADFLDLGDGFAEDKENSVMIDGHVISDHNNNVIPGEDKDPFNPDEFLDKKSFKRMSWGLWLSENRRNLTKTLVVVLIMISAAFFVYSVYNLVIYFYYGDPAKNTIENNLSVEGRQGASNLEISPIKRLISASKDDLAVLIKNPNNNFSAEFSYCFLQGETEISCDNSFIMPSEEKYILSLGLNSLAGGAPLGFSINNISWRRLDTKNIPDFSIYSHERLNFIISDLAFSPAAAGISDVIDLNSLKFSISNETPYSYYEVPLVILIYRNEELSGVNRYVLNNFWSGDKKDINLAWSGDLRGSRRVEIIPDLNIFDSQVFTPYKGQ